MISISFYITTCQGHHMHASIHHDDIETFAPILQLHETFYIPGYDLCRSLLKSNGDDFYYDILFQSSTTVHQCPSSINLTVEFSSTEFRIIKYLLGDDNYVLGKYYISSHDKSMFNCTGLLALSKIFIFRRYYWMYSCVSATNILHGNGTIN